MKKYIKKNVEVSLKVFLALLLCVGSFGLLPEKVEAAISFVGSAESSSVGVNDTTVDLTTITGLAEGDLVIVAGAIGDDDSINLDVLNNSGYAEIADLFSNDTDDTNLAVFWKIMSASPDTSVVVEGSTGGTDSSIAVVVMVFRGVDQATPFDVTSTTATGLDTFSPNPPSINHNNPSGVWTAIAGANSHILGGAGTYTFPTGYTTGAIDRGSDDTNDTTVGMGYRSSGVSDPEDPGVMTHSGTLTTNNSWAAVTMALRPQAAAAPTVTTDAETNQTPSSATLNGNVTNLNSGIATFRGFTWGTSATLQDPFATSSESYSTTGTFSLNIRGLIAGATYYYRAYAINSAGTGYGTIEQLVAGTDTSTVRTMRLFEGGTIKFIDGTIRLYPQG